MLLICFGHYYAHHQELTTVMLITTLLVAFLFCCRFGSWVRVGWSSVRAAGYCPLQPTGNQERDDQCGNQHYSRELLMMGVVVPETC